MRFNLSLFLAVLPLALPAVAAPEIKIAGATTVFLSVVKNNKDAVSKEAGVSINAVGSTTGSGFAALQAGQIDIAMSTDTLAGLADGAAKKGTSINPADYQEFFIKNAYLVFVCHKSNPVTALTEAQIKGILSGQIRNWKEVGGADSPIAIFYERESSGNYGLLKKNLMKETALTTRGLTYVDNARLIVSNVADIESAFGPTADFYLDGSVKVIDGFRVSQYLCFITKKNPSADVVKVIEAFKAKVK
ncbi:MAG: substrate-binding domain-containing protein [Nibricoccus sp.]